jgi:hypothetical protein
MAAAASTRPRLTSTGLGRKPRRPWGTIVLVAVPLVLVASLAWQLASSMLHTDVVVRQAAGVGQVTLEADPAGTRINFVLVDRIGQDTTLTGSVDVRLRGPDGAVWTTTRNLSGSDFQPLPATSLMAGRAGYSVLVPAGDWVRQPRRGGLATVTISVNPSDGGTPFSADSQLRFP